MVYKYVSVYNVVEKIYRDSGIQEELDIWDVVEWAAEALEFIGAGQQYERRVVELEIKNHLAKLPCNFHSNPIPSCEGSPMSLATGGFAPMSSDTTSSTSTVNGKEVDKDGFPRSGDVNRNSGYQSYYIKDGVFVASIAEGTVVLEYRAIATDEEGFPKVPDLVSYRTAISKYVQMMLDIRAARKGILQKGWADKSEADWQWYCKQARGAANMPNLSYAESIKNMWVKLKPNQNAAASFHNTGTMREMRKLK